MRQVIAELRRVVGGPDAAPTDAELLDAYVAAGDPDAFEALVRRHGPMVLGVCRRILHHAQDAEDAFQATFLVLVRKATTIAPRGVVGSWLYSVARQTAQKALATNLRRATVEQSLPHPPEPAVAPAEPTGETAALLDVELAGLPEAYRTAIVLCDLEGRTGREAARLLGWPEGTLFTRLSRGRKLLADRLARRGVTPAVAAVTAVPAALMTTTVQAASGAAVAPAVLALTEGVLHAMIPVKVKLFTATVFAFAVLGAAFAGGRMAQGPTPTTPPTAEGQVKAEPAPAAKGVTWADLHNDSIWIDIGVPRLNINTLIPHPTTNCTACHTPPVANLQTARLRWAFVDPHSHPSTLPWLFHQPVNPPDDAHVQLGLRWLRMHQRQEQLQDLAQNLDRDTVLELLRLIERRDAARHAVQAVDQALGKVRQDGKDSKAELEAIDALLKHLQQRKADLQKPAEPKKP